LQIRSTFQQRRDHLLASLRSLGLRCITPEGAFYTMLDVSRFGSSLRVAETILQGGVVTVPGNAFGSEGEGFLRCSFCADLPVLTEGVTRLSGALKKLRS
jgi:aspartate/methionine/tyrosine aminotransferase